jgi:ParB-like chromosome segregation protein Spo0J
VIQTIKLNNLRLSPINVRSAPDEQLQIEPMAASIEAKGVLQNLLVTPAKKPRGTYEVFDGGRRWRAMQLLVQRGTIVDSEYDVPVMVLTGEADPLVPTWLSEELADELPLASLVIVAEAAHVPQLERADAVDMLIAAFLARLELSFPEGDD